MASETIGTLYPTRIPSYEDKADIQSAIRVYHYGTENFDPQEDDPSQLPNPSIARYLYQIETDIDVIQSKGLGSAYLSSQPSGVDNGFIWVDSTSSGSVVPVYSAAVYSGTAPTNNLVDGVIWVDKDSEEKRLYTWDASLSEWISINNSFNVVENKGDILVANEDGDLDNLPIGINNGYVLTVDNTATYGLAWKQQQYQDDTIAFVMGIY
jgi:hypothetical protein